MDEKKTIVNSKGEPINKGEKFYETNGNLDLTKEKFVARLVLKYPEVSGWLIIVLVALVFTAFGFGVTQFISRREFIDDIYVDLMNQMQELATESDLDKLENRIDEQNKKIEDLLINYTEVKVLFGGEGVLLKTVDSAPVIEANLMLVDYAGEKYTANDLIDENILISYEENGCEVFFLGKYNSAYHWEGFCVTNAYKSNGVLESICESNFNDGTRLDYVSLYNNGEDYTYSNRKVVGDENIGITKHYMFDEYVRAFNSENVTIGDMLFVETFLDKTSNIVMTEFYNGKTSNGEFNDDTGNACRITFDSNGFVRTYYKGKFKNKNANDDTYLAFSLIYVDGVGYYYNHDTIFSNGKADTKATIPLDSKELLSLTLDIVVDGTTLKWYGIDDFI